MTTDAKNSTTTLPTWSFTLLIIGLFLSAVGIMFVLFAPKSDNLTSRAEGVVSRVESEKHRSKNRTKTTYLTYVQFEDSDHRLFEARSVVNGGTQRHWEGDSVVVWYDPRDPEAGCLIEGDEDRQFLFKLLQYTCQFGGPAAALVGGASILFVKFRQRAKA